MIMGVINVRCEWTLCTSRSSYLELATHARRDLIREELIATIVRSNLDTLWPCSQTAQHQLFLFDLIATFLIADYRTGATLTMHFHSLPSESLPCLPSIFATRMRRSTWAVGDV